jgi:hypothetical protein
VTDEHLRIPDSLAHGVIRRRWIALASIAALTAIMTVAASRAPWRSSLVECFMSDRSTYESYREQLAAYGGGSDDVLLLVTDEGSDVFNAETLDRIRTAADALQNHASVERAISIVDAPYLANNRPISFREVTAKSAARAALDRGQLPIRTDAEPVLYWPRSQQLRSRADLALVRAGVLEKDPLARLLVSRDGRGLLIVIQLDESASRVGSAPQLLAAELKQILRENGLGRQAVHAAGSLVIESSMLSVATQTAQVLLPISLTLICLIVWLIFHRLSLVLLTVVIAAVATSWSVGAAALAFGHITLLVAAAPMLVLVISTSDTIHIASAYDAEMRSGSAPRDAVVRTITGVGGACILTSATTFVGFISLMLIPAATLQHLSLAIAVGVASALLLALTICPIVLDALPAKRGGTSHTPASRLVYGLVVVCRRIALGYPRAVTIGLVGLMILSAAGAMRLELIADFPARFPPSHDARRATELLNSRFHGANSLDMFLNVAPARLYDDDVHAGLAAAEQRVLSELPAVRHIVSLNVVLRTGEALLGFPPDEPTTSTRRSALTRLFVSQAGGAAASLVDTDGGGLRVTLQIAPTGVFSSLDVARRVDEIFREELPADVKVDTTGSYVVIGRAAELVIASQRRGSLICFVSVLTLIAIGIRSLKLSLLAVPANLLPLALLGGILSLSGRPVDSDILGVAIVSFGLAVDDTIHFLHRYRVERATTDYRAALERTYEYTGVAILRTTAVLSIGLAPFAWAGYLSLWFLGTYLVFVLVCAVAGDLLLLPATICWWESRRKTSDDV